MRKIIALIHARNKEFYRDRSTLIWSLVFPFVVLAGFRYGYSGRQDPILRITAFPPAVVSQLTVKSLKEMPGVELKTTDQEADALQKLGHYESDLVLSAPSEGGRLIYSVNGDSEKGRLAERLLQLASNQPGAPRVTLEPRRLTGRHIRYSDWLLPGLLAMNIMFGSMFGVGYVIVRYRKNGVLKRLRATPLSAFQFLSAQVLSRMLLMVVTSGIVLVGSMLLVGFQPQGSWLDLLAFLCVSSAAMISVGLVVAARITSEEVADGVLNLMTWPMIFLSGIWFSIEGATSWVLWAAKLVPLTHVVDGLRAILIEGTPLTQLLPQVGILLCLSLVFIVIGSAIFRWR